MERGIPKKEALLISMEKLKAVDLSLNIANTYLQSFPGHAKTCSFSQGLLPKILRLFSLMNQQRALIPLLAEPLMI